MRSTEHRPAPGAAAVISLLILFVGLPHQVVAGPHKRGCHLVGESYIPALNNSALKIGVIGMHSTLGYVRRKYG